MRLHLLAHDLNRRQFLLIASVAAVNVLLVLPAPSRGTPWTFSLSPLIGTMASNSAVAASLASTASAATTCATRSAATGFAMPRVPQLFLGTLGLDGPDAVGTAIRSAIASGFRHIDCAPVYYNEHHIGDALKREFDSGAVRREDLFITSKLACPFHRKEHVEPALRKTLSDLRLDYLDLYLVHWPVAFRYVDIGDDDRNGRGYSNEDIDDSDGGDNIDPTVSVHETWSAMEEMLDKGLVRNIGVSNFPVALLHELLSDCRIPPAVNQVELHPYLQQGRLLEYCAARGVRVQAYSPLGTPGYKEQGEPSVLGDPVLADIAARRNVTVAQLSLAWSLQRGCFVVAKASSSEHLSENNQVATDRLRLTEDEMTRIAQLDRGYRFFRPEDWWGSMKLAVFD